MLINQSMRLQITIFASCGTIDILLLNIVHEFKQAEMETVTLTAFQIYTNILYNYYLR